MSCCNRLARAAMRRRISLLAAAAAISFTAVHARATTYTWIGPDAGEWFIDGNWSSPGSPSSTDDAQLNSGANAFISTGSPNINDLSVAHGGALTLQSNTSIGGLTLSVVDFNNAGIFTLASDGNIYTSTLAATGTIHNLSTGQILISGPTSITGELSNDGAIHVNYNATFTGLSSNQNAITLAPSTTLTISGTTFTQTAGSLSGDPTSVVFLNNSTFNFNGGSISAPVQLSNSSLSTPDLGGASTPSNFNFISTGSLLTNLRQGVVVTATSNDTVGPVTLQMPTDSTIKGTVHLTNNGTNLWDTTLSTNNPADSTLTTLTNQGSLYADAGTGGNRNISANLINQSTFTATAPVNFVGDVTNTGTISLSNTATLTNHTFAQLAGSLVLNGPFNINNSVLQLGSATQSGGSVTGSGPINLTNSTLRTFADTNVGPLTINYIGNGAVDGNLTTGLTLNVISNDSVGPVVLQMPMDSTIKGIVHLTNNGTNPWDTTLTTNNPNTGTLTTLTNQGSIFADAGTVPGGTRNISANLINQSTFTATAPVNFAGDVTNTGTISLSNTATLTNHTFAQLAGSLVLNGPFNINNSVLQLGSATQSGGSVTGAGPINLTNSTLRTFDDTNVGPLTINYIGNGAVDGNLTTGLTLNVISNDSVGPVVLQMPMDSTIKGTVHLTNNGTNPWDATLSTNNPNTGTLTTLTNQGSIFADAGTGGNRIISANLINQSIFTATAPVNFAGDVTNTGSISLSNTTTLSNHTFAQLAGSLVLNGPFNINNGTLQLGSATQSGGSVTGAGPINLANSTLRTFADTNVGPLTINYISNGAVDGNLTTGLTVNVTSNDSVGPVVLQMPMDSTIKGIVHLTNNGTNAWNTTLSTNNPNTGTLTTLTNQGSIFADAGTVGNRIISANLINSPTGFLTVSAPTTIPGSLDNTGTITLNDSSSLSIYGATVQLFAGNTLTAGTWVLNGNNTLTFSDIDPVTGITTLASAATVIMNSPGSTPAFANLSSNQGSLSLNTGRIFTTASDFSNAGSLSIDPTSTLSVTGNYTQTAGTTTVNGTLSSPTLIDIQAGTLAGSGTVSGPAHVAGTLSPAGTLHFNNSLTLTSTAHTLVHLASASHDQITVAGPATLAGNLSATLSPGYTPTAATNLTLLTSPSITGSYSNRRTAGTPTGSGFLITNSSTAVTLNNYNQVHWTPNADGQWTTPTNWDTDNTLPLPSDDVTLDVGGATVRTITLSSGTQSINSLNSNENLTLSGGTLSLANASTVNGKFNFSNGTLTGSGTLTETGAFTWSGGIMAGSGTTLIASTGTLSITGGGLTLDRTLENDGTATWTSGSIVPQTNSTFNNVGTFTASSSSALTYQAQGGSTDTFNNSGTFIKAGSGTAVFTVFSGAITFNNSGTVKVQQGTLTLSGGLAQLPSSTLTAGTWNISNNATLDLSGSSNITTLASPASVTLDGSASSFPKLNSLTTNQGSLTLTNGRSFTTASSLTNSGTLTLGPSATLTLPAAAVYTQTAGTTSLSSATLSGPINILAGSLTGTGAVSGPATIAGTLSPGSPIGTLAFGSSLTLTSSSTTNLDLSTPSSDLITVTGATSLAGNLSLSFLNGFTPSPNQSFTLLTSGSSITGSFANIPSNSFITIPGSAGRALVTYAGSHSLTLTAAGTIHWNVNSDGDWATPSNWDTNAVPTAAADVVIDRPAGLYTVTVSSGAQAANSLTSNENLTLTGGSLDLATASTLNGALTLAGGVLQGAGNVTLNAPSTWTTGNMAGTGKTTVSSTGSLAVTANGNINLYRTLENAGAVTLAGSAGWSFSNSAVFNNLSTGTLTATDNTTIYSSVGNNMVINDGDFYKSGAGTTTALKVPFSNTGGVSVLSGTLRTDLAVTQLPSTTLTGGTWAVSNNATLNLAGSSNITTSNAVVTLDGPNSSFPQINSLAVNQGFLLLKGGRSFTTAGAFSNSSSGWLFIGPSSSFESTGAFTNTGLVNLTSGTLKLDQGIASSTVAAQLLAAYNNGAWNGITGITSTTAAADPTHRTAITYSLTGTNTYTFQLGIFGDANLDGRINADDYALTDRGLAKHLTGWQNGDFNYDGQVTSADYLLLDHSFLLSQAPGFNPGSFLAQRDAQFGDAYVSSLLASVPEPSLALGLLAPLFLTRRRLAKKSCI